MCGWRQSARKGLSESSELCSLAHVAYFGGLQPRVSHLPRAPVPPPPGLFWGTGCEVTPVRTLDSLLRCSLLQSFCFPILKWQQCLALDNEKCMEITPVPPWSWVVIVSPPSTLWAEMIVEITRKQTGKLTERWERRGDKEVRKLRMNVRKKPRVTVVRERRMERWHGDKERREGGKRTVGEERKRWAKKRVREMAVPPFSQGLGEWESAELTMSVLAFSAKRPKHVPDSLVLWLTPLSWPGPRKVPWSQQCKERLMIPFPEEIQTVGLILRSVSSWKPPRVSLVQSWGRKVSKGTRGKGVNTIFF